MPARWGSFYVEILPYSKLLIGAIPLSTMPINGHHVFLFHKVSPTLQTITHRPSAKIREYNTQDVVKCILQGSEHLNFTPNQSLEPVQILCIVEHIVCLIREGVARYVERIRQARCRQANERGTGSDGNNLK